MFQKECLTSFDKKQSKNTQQNVARQISIVRYTHIDICDLIFLNVLLITECTAHMTLSLSMIN